MTCDANKSINIRIRRIVDYISNTAPCMFGSNGQNGFSVSSVASPVLVGLTWSILTPPKNRKAIAD